MLPIYSDTFFTATRTHAHIVTPDYRLIHPTPRKPRGAKLSRRWFWLF